VSICRRAFAKATAEGYDTIIVDTAGRQVVDKPLMDELKQIKGAILPDEVLLVVDTMIGQEAATLTAKFNDEVGITGAILTKMDGDSRGGAALSVRGVSGKPIKFVGVGEGMDDLEPFYPERMASRILGMGDVATLLEKAQSAVDADVMKKVGKRMQKGSYDFNDFLVQAQTVRKMGGMNMIKLMPGMAGKITDEMIFDAERRSKLSETIVGAMTEEERSNPDLIVATGGKKELVQDAERRKRELADRSGTTIKEIDGFVVEFNNMKKMMMKNLKGMDMDAADPNQPMQTQQAMAAQAKKEKKLKPTRGGGAGFGGK